MMAVEGSVGTFTTDRELVVRTWEPWLERATGVPAADALGRPLTQLFPDVASRGLERRLRRVAAEGTVEILAPAFHAFLIPCAPLAPSALFVRMQQHVTVTPLRTGGAIDGVVVTIEDVTSRVERERALATALASEDEETRRRAEAELARADGAAASLTGALADERWRVRRAAAGHLAQSGGDATDALITMLRDRHRDPGALNATLTGLVNTSEDVVPALVALLGEGDVELRTYAALALGHRGDSRAVPPLLALLDDADVNVRQHAIEALGRIGAREAAPALAELAETRDFYLAFAALDALAAIGEPSVAPRLVPMVGDELLGEAVVHALARLGDADVAAPIAARLGEAGTDASAIANALALLHERFADRPAVAALVESLASAAVTPQGGRTLVAALGRASDGDLPAIVRVLSWFEVEDAEAELARVLARDSVRHEASDALARRGARALDPLLEALGGEGAEVRKAAASALGRIGIGRSVPALLRVLDDEPGVIIAAAGALGEIGDPSAYEPLLALFDHEDPAVRQAAVAALDSIGHPAMPDRIRRMLGDSSPRIRESAARVAGYFGYPECLEPMLALSRDADDVVRRVAVEHLAYFDDPSAVGAVAAAIGSDQQPVVRAAGARALAHADSDVALPALLGALGDPDLWVRYHSARSLGAHGLTVAADRLGELARSDPVPPVRIASIEALAQIGARESAALLDALSADEDAEVAAAARRSAARLAGDDEVDGHRPDDRTSSRTPAQ